MNLYQYRRARVQDGIQDWLGLFEGGESSWIEQARAASEMKFRDRAGRYWYADIYADEWYFFQDGKWLLSSEVPEVLEGPAALFPGDQEKEIPSEDLDQEPISVQGSPVQVLEDSLRKLRVDYQDGKLSSWDVLAISRRHYLIDQEGQFWTQGLSSGDWYRIEEGDWEKAAGPPPLEELLELKRDEDCASCGKDLEGKLICPHCGQENPPELPELPDRAYQRLLDFILRDQPLPEEVTAPWEPPDGYPAGVAEHFQRQGLGDG